MRFLAFIPVIPVTLVKYKVYECTFTKSRQKTRWLKAGSAHSYWCLRPQWFPIRFRSPVSPVLSTTKWFCHSVNLFLYKLVKTADIINKNVFDRSYQIPVCNSNSHGHFSVTPNLQLPYFKKPRSTVSTRSNVLCRSCCLGILFTADFVSWTYCFWLRVLDYDVLLIWSIAILTTLNVKQSEFSPILHQRWFSASTACYMPSYSLKSLPYLCALPLP
jgi:hypothetical protein